MERVLDRVPEFDALSRNYSIRSLLSNDQPRGYTWQCERVLDQGTEGACVGFAFAHEAIARPNKRIVDETFARQIYAWAQRNDAWPGENYSGTSVLAGAKAMQREGYIKEYRWAFNLNDLLTAVSRRGPVVLGINWHDDMWDTDDKGFIHASGRVVGGHAILMRGVSKKYRYAVLHNSWGPGWGQGGAAKISWDDLELLLNADGEACIPVVRG